MKGACFENWCSQTGDGTYVASRNRKTLLFCSSHQTDMGPPSPPFFNVANDILECSPPKVQRAQPRPNGIYFATTMQSVGRPKRKPLANFEGGGVGDEAEGQTTIVHTFVFAFSVATIVPSPAFGTE